MADVWDSLEADYGGQEAVTTVAPSVDVWDSLEADYATAPANNSEVRGIANRGLQGLSSFLGLVDQFNPIRPNFDKPGTFGVPQGTVSLPPLFGLFPDGQAPIGQVFDEVTKDYGIQTEDKPQTVAGKITGNALENALAAVGFGPAAMAGNAFFGGGGASVGEAIAGEKGRVYGSITGGLSPIGISKLGVVKEIGEQLGPTVSQLPVLREIFGNAPVQAAVGRALGKSSDDIINVEKVLKEVSESAGPPTKLNSLKTTAEIVGDSGIARAEDAVENMLPGAGFKNIATERAAIRAEDVLENYDPKVTPYETSKALESSVTKAIENIEEVESAAWKALPKDAPVNTKLGTLADDLQTAIDDITFSGDVPVTGTAAALLKRANNLGTEGTTSFHSLQKLRSQSLTLARATAKGSDDAERVANQVSNAIASHLDDVIDANVAAGNFSDDAANIWREARALTKDKVATFGASRPGVQNTGTKALEQLGLKGQALDNTTLIREGLSSPDKLAAHIRAAAKGGQDVRPIYKQALQSELDGVSQTRWKDVIGSKRNQWEQVFTKDEMAAIDRNLADIESEIVKGRLSTTTNSMTNPRGNTQRILNAEKGIAAFSTGLGNAATLAGGVAGAKAGWDSADTTGGGVVRGLLGAVVGATTGKASKSALSRASDKYDNILTEALKNPTKALEAIEAAKPSDIGKAVQSSILGAGKAAGTSALGSALRSVMGSNQQPMTELYTGPNAEKQSKLNQLLTNTTGVDMDQSDEFLSKEEGGQRLTAYYPNVKGSGVTVGTGVDLGSRSKSELESLGISESLIDKITPYLGKKDSDAQSIIKSKPLKLTSEEATELDTVIKADIFSTVENKLSAEGVNFKEIPEEAQTVIKSISYNFGKNFDEKLPSLWSAITSQDWPKLQDLLVTTKWKQPELLARRKREAELLGRLV